MTRLRWNPLNYPLKVVNKKKKSHENSLFVSDDEPPAHNDCFDRISRYPCWKWWGGATICALSTAKQPVNLLFLDVKIPATARYGIFEIIAASAQVFYDRLPRIRLEGYDLDAVDCYQTISLETVLRAIQKKKKKKVTGFDEGITLGISPRRLKKPATGSTSIFGWWTGRW